jgi:hypothetical protein
MAKDKIIGTLVVMGTATAVAIWMVAGFFAYSFFVPINPVRIC